MMMHHREKNVLAFAKSLGVFLTNQELRLIDCYQERFRMPLPTWFRECSLELAEGDSSPSAIFPENWPLTYPFASHCTCSFTQHIWSCGGCSVCRPSNWRSKCADASLLSPVGHCAPGIVFPLLVFAHFRTNVTTNLIVFVTRREIWWALCLADQQRVYGAFSSYN